MRFAHSGHGAVTWSHSMNDSDMEAFLKMPTLLLFSHLGMGAYSLGKEKIPSFSQGERISGSYSICIAFYYFITLGYNHTPITNNRGR